MKSPGKFFKSALECVTQCVLLPGVELRFDEVFRFYAKNFESLMSKHRNNK